MPKDIIKEFREKFPSGRYIFRRFYADDSSFMRNCRDSVEQFLLKALKDKRADLLREIKEGLPKEEKNIGDLTSGSFEQARNLGYNQYRQESMEFLKKLK